MHTIWSPLSAFIAASLRQLEDHIVVRLPRPAHGPYLGLAGRLSFGAVERARLL